MKKSHSFTLLLHEGDPSSRLIRDSVPSATKRSPKFTLLVNEGDPSLALGMTNFTWGGGAERAAPVQLNKYVRMATLNLDRISVNKKLNFTAEKLN